MKKFLMIGFAVVALSAVVVTSSVYAQMGKGGAMNNGGQMANCGANGGQMMGHGCGNGNGGHMGGGHGGCGVNANTPVITQKDAEVKVKEYIKTFKGYKMKNIETFKSRNGHTGFIANVEDGSGNKLIVKVSPYGNIRGPIMNMNPIAK